jgi:HlyD family secretion protein
MRSFTYVVTPHTPLRPVAAKPAEPVKKQPSPQQQRGGGGRGGRGGGRGGGSMEQEKPGSTRILTILPQGSTVKAGDVVAELDKSTFVDEEKNQEIRYAGAKAYVDQAKAMLEVAEISLREYRDGIYPQDVGLIEDYIETCQIESDRAKSNLKWSREMLALGFRTPSQVLSDTLAVQQTEFALTEAKGMYLRLTKYTGPKIIKALEANVEAIKSDKLTQEASFSLEEQRLKRLRRNIEKCTVKAPGDGIVVYVEQQGRGGQQAVVIEEGVTLHENQAIFNLPDPKHMRVRAKINETRVALVHKGQPALVLVDAFPNHPLQGIVDEVTAISAALRETDVRIYYANITITEEFEKLRPGLSAEILIDIERRHEVTRVPVESIRWVANRSYVALFDRARGEADKPPWRWQEIQIGLSDPEYAEVLDGLKAGDRVVARPANLPAPAPERLRKAAAVAVVSQP